MTGTRRAAVLGSPITHSLSPVLHRAAYAALGLPWEYSAISVDESTLPEFWSTLDDTWVGLSLTMPLKVAVLDLLDDISPLALSIGAVNTVVFESGRAFGHNTDVPGMIRALDDAQPDRDRVSSASIVGAGATARSALAALVARHGRNLPITIYARRSAQVREVISIAEELGGDVRPGQWHHLPRAWAADLVVSTLPGTAEPEVTLPARPGLLMDVAYDPWPTPLSTRWRSAGSTVATGADLLLGQAVDQVRLMTGRDAPVEAMRSALLAALDERAGTGV